MQSLTGKATGATLSAAEWNQLPQEVQNIITAAGQTLSISDLNQLGKAVATYSAVSDFYIDSGAADAYDVAPVTGFQGPVAYFDGMRVRFQPTNANVGTTATVDVNGLGVRPIVRQDAANLSANTEFQVGVSVELEYDVTAVNFKIINAIEVAPLFAIKPADTSRSLTITPTDDPDLSVPVIASTKYSLECFLSFFDNTGGVRLSFNCPASITTNLSVQYRDAVSDDLQQSDALAFNPNSVNIAMPDNAGTVSIVRVKGTVSVGANAGDFVVQWAQETSDATATILAEDSFIKMEKLA